MSGVDAAVFLEAVVRELRRSLPAGVSDEDVDTFLRRHRRALLAEIARAFRGRASRAAFERAEVRVRVRGNSGPEMRPVTGWRVKDRPELAVTPHVAGLSGWMLTHVPSGNGMLRDYTSLKLAKANARAFAALPVPTETWAITDEQALARALPRVPGFHDALRQAGAAAFDEQRRRRPRAG